VGNLGGRIPPTKKGVKNMPISLIGDAVRDHFFRSEPLKR